MTHRFAWLAVALVLAAGCSRQGTETAQNKSKEAGAAAAQEQVKDKKPKTSPDQSMAKEIPGQVASCVKVDGALLEQTKSGFTTVRVGDPIMTDKLLIGLPAGELVTNNKRVKIGLLLHIGDLLPVTEAAAVLHDNKDFDADVSINRGVVSIQNMSDKGDVRVKVRGGKQEWELTFKEPDTTVLLARFGRHEPGTRLFRKQSKKDDPDAPLMHFGMLVVKGRISVYTGSDTFALNSPPGPAMIAWDTVGGVEIKHHDKLPDAVNELDITQMKNFAAVCAATAKLAAGDLGKGIDGMVDSGNEVEQRVAVACMGALDDVPRLWAALENPRHAAVRDQAVITLRNWIGREPGQLTKLHEHIAKSKNYNPIQTKNILVLLKGFDEDDRKEPIVYQLLIGALEFGPMPIRELANWNLERLAPAGQKIAFDAGADDAARSKAVTQWRELIPEGQLPPPPKKDDIKKGK